MFLKIFKIYQHFLLVAAILFLGLVWNLFFVFQPVVHGSLSDNIRGWGWSENIGWVSLNCYNDWNNDGQFEYAADNPSCSNSSYGLNLNEGTNKITGYAWSENIGWLCFGSSCSGTAPDGNSPLACLGNRSGNNCSGDRGEDFSDTSQLMAHWKMNNLTGDGTTADSSGKGNIAYLKPAYPSDSPIQTNGKFDQAFYFDGGNDYIEVNYSGDLNLSDVFTIEAWVKQRTTGVTRYVVSREDLVNNRGYGFGLDSNNRLFLTLPGQGTITSTSNCSYPSNPDAGVKNSCLTDTKKWHHLAVTRDASNNFRFYLDGFLNGEVINNSSVAGTGTGNLSLGRRSNGTAYFQGSIDNASIWKRAKSTQEIWDDAVAEISGWAKIESIGDNGWIKLKATQEANNSWWGVWRDSAVSGYVLGGWAWGDNPSPPGIGWLKFDYYSKPLPGSFDNLRLNNTLDCQKMLVQWDVSQGAESYSYLRCDNVSSGQCGTCSYTSRPVPSGTCLGNECYVLDTGLTENTGYCYKIKAENETGETDNSDGPKWETTIYCAPRPENLTIDGSECGMIKAQWLYSPIAEGYTLYRTLLSDGCTTLTGLPCQAAAYLGEALSWDNLVAHWRMNEASWSGASGEVFDVSGYGNHGTAKKGATTAIGKFQRAGSFDGNNDYAEVPDAASLDIQNAITVEGWVKFDDSKSMTILAKGETYKLEKLDNNHFAFWVWIGGSWQGGQGQTAAAVGQWYHLAGTYDGSKIKIFVNGNSDGEYNVSGQIQTNNIPLSIGAYSKNGSAYGNEFDGLIDNLAIYSRAKLTPEIKLDSEAVSLTQCDITCGVDTCCRYSDSRIIPQVNYYYRATSTYRNRESDPSIGHILGKTVCFPPVKVEEK